MEHEDIIWADSHNNNYDRQVNTLEVVDLEDVRVDAKGDRYAHTNIDETKKSQENAPRVENKIE